MSRLPHATKEQLDLEFRHHRPQPWCRRRWL